VGDQPEYLLPPDSCATNGEVGYLRLCWIANARFVVIIVEKGDEEARGIVVRAEDALFHLLAKLVHPSARNSELPQITGRYGECC
jgi:hypothetical protein